MSAPPVDLDRLRFLARVAERLDAQLRATDQRIFQTPFTPARARTLRTDTDLAERVDAFGARFGRLQDTLGDKLLPALLRALAETPGAVIDNLDRAERLQWIASADDWLAMRRLRNQMVHEYIDDPEILANALQAAHEYVPVLLHAAAAFRAEIRRRGWLPPNGDPAA